MADYIQDGAALIELGAGALRKTAILLDAIERQGKKITFYALDLDHTELVRTLSQLSGRYRNVSLYGLWGTYDDGCDWLSSIEEQQRVLLWLGSSIGNLTRRKCSKTNEIFAPPSFFSLTNASSAYYTEEAKQFVHGFGRVLRPGVDKFIIAIDSKYNAVSAMTKAYNDSEGVTSEFALNLLDSLDAMLGKAALNRESFEYCPYFNQAEGRNEAYLRCKSPVDVTVANKRIQVREEELIRFAYSHKYDNAERELLWSAANCYVEEEWLHSPCSRGRGRYSISLVAFHA